MHGELFDVFMICWLSTMSFTTLYPFFWKTKNGTILSSQFQPFNSRTSKTSIHSTVHGTMLPAFMIRRRRAFMIRRRRNSRTPKYRLTEVISICATTDVPPKHVDKKVRQCKSKSSWWHIDEPTTVITRHSDAVFRKEGSFQIFQRSFSKCWNDFPDFKC